MSGSNTPSERQGLVTRTSATARVRASTTTTVTRSSAPRLSRVDSETAQNGRDWGAPRRMNRTIVRSGWYVTSRRAIAIASSFEISEP